jgi:hypothetical protein
MDQIDLFANIAFEVHPTHPPHITSIEYRLWESNVLDANTQPPYHYVLLRKWDCNCASNSHKKKTLHSFQLNSPLALGHPDDRIYSVFRLLGSVECKGEPLHAQSYRGIFEEQQLLDGFHVGSVSDIIDLTNRLNNGEVVLDEDGFQLCNCIQHPLSHAPHLRLDD